MPSPSSPMISRSQLSARATSPLPSANSITGDRSPADNPTSATRNLFNRLRGHKGNKSSADSLKSLPGSQRSLQDPYAKVVKLDPIPAKRGREGSIAMFDSNTTLRPIDTYQPEPSPRKESKIKFGGKFPTPSRNRFVQENEKNRNNEPATAETYFDLDLNLENMEGIISAPPPETPMTGGVLTGRLPNDEGNKDSWDTAPLTGPGAWDAPDSWAVKKVGDENVPRVREMEEEDFVPEDEDSGMPHGLRVFRVDSTFATLSTGVNTTADEILQILGKKSFLQDELNTYQIIMKKHDLQRQLAPGERPVAIQRRLLEQAGYEASDHIEEIGREDNSYLCRFTFVPTKISGYYSLERDPGLERTSKFNHVDLSGRSLVTIPIMLYKKAGEITILNLSRNLALDVPKDFIQSCVILREIRFTSNEAWQIPASFSLAPQLRILDISNNRLEQLDQADLGKLQNIVSIKIANNRLTTLPPSFGEFRTLRSLNLSSNYLSTFPDFLYNLRTLVDIDISFNMIESLPNIGKLTGLERLWATNNQLTGSFPDDFVNLGNLKELDVRFNGLTSMDVIATLPKLEQLMIGHNAISKFEGSFERLRILNADHNPITRFDFKAEMPTLTTLNLAHAKITHLDDSAFERVWNLTKLILNDNQFTAISSQIGRLAKLEYLSVAKNALMTLPPTIGCLQELRFLDAHECNIRTLPVELWCCLKLDTLNLSCNVLESFPKLTPTLQAPTMETHTPALPQLQTVPCNTPTIDESGKPEEFGHRRPSQASGGLLSVGSSPVGSTRKNSIVSIYGPGGRKASVISRTPTGDGITPLTRKDSNISSRLSNTFAGSLRHLAMADNRLRDDIFEVITLCPELRTLNLSYNELEDIPQNALRRWPQISSLFLSGNELASLPTDDLAIMDNHPLKLLYVNGNKFQNLPAELGKVQNLIHLDIGSNILKYNVSNWRYDWNWNFNPNLKYLNFSGNKRLEVKPLQGNTLVGGLTESQDLTHFNSLKYLRVLGLMDVTLMIPNVPEESDDRRVRTSGTSVGTMTYGMADSLGKFNEHLSIFDLLIPKFRSHDTETLLGLFDGQSMSNGGSKVAKFLHENFGPCFTQELERIKEPETAVDALRRTFLALNKELATAASSTLDEREHRVPKITNRGVISAHTLNSDDLESGGVATVLFLDNMDLYIANVGDAQAILMHSDGGYHVLTEKHKPANPQERQRIREAGAYVSRQGKLNDVLEVSRAFGYIHHMPAVMASPSIQQVTLREQDEMVLIASSNLWDYLTFEVAVDVARSERSDVLRAAQKLRDLAISFGATNKIMVMIVGVSDLKKRERKGNKKDLSLGPTPLVSEHHKRRKLGRDGPNDSTLARLDDEVDAPTGELSLVFTDIKSSTALWELFPVAMRSSIRLHNDLLRRQLRIIGGYEVKTEGDAFMVAFPTATSALLWAFSIQNMLLQVPWPNEVLDSIHGQEVVDNDGNCIYRGLSVRMGIHWGSPVCEMDPITKRMDYFGPMVNRAARIESVADGGQITVSQDFITEIQRTLETYAESDRSSSTGSEDTIMEDATAMGIRRDLRALSTQGFEVKDLGERKLKGLENPEYIYLMYPYILAARLTMERPGPPAADPTSPVATAPPRQSQLSFDPQSVWDLWNISLRLEMICSALETPGAVAVPKPELGMLERMKNRGGEVTDRFLCQFVEHLVARVEVGSFPVSFTSFS